MNDLSKFDQFYLKIKGNRWYWYFSIFCRLSLAFGFIMAGIVKITDERFASGLSEIHPMGSYLVALHHTDYYYHFIGIAQILAAILLLIPRTVTLGALLYFPIIVNICILSFALRFDGSFVSAPLMVLANIYLLVWNYDKLKYILPFKRIPDFGIVGRPVKYSNKFPVLFFAAVAATFVLIVSIFLFGSQVMPHNSLKDCNSQFVHTKREHAGAAFCECIHTNGKPLKECLTALENSK